MSPGLPTRQIENIGGMYAISANAQQMADAEEKMGTKLFTGIKKGIV